jgi:hypothetical protein
LRCKHWAAHSDRSFSRPSLFRARAASIKSSSAARASETIPKSEHAADLRRLDIDVNELASLGYRARLSAGVAIGHVRGALDMSRQNMSDRASLAQRRIEWINRGAGHAEGDRDSLLLQHKHRSVHLAHPRHGFVFLRYCYPLSASKQSAGLLASNQSRPMVGAKDNCG